MARSNDNFRSDDGLRSSSRLRSSNGPTIRETSGPSQVVGRQNKHHSGNVRKSAQSRSDREGSVPSAWRHYGDGEGQQAPTGECFVVGFDYGATFSGVGYILVDHSLFRAQALPESLINEVQVLRNYEGQEEYHSKYVVPTVMTYNRSGSDVTPLKWGFPSLSTRKVQDRNIHKIELAKLLFSKQHRSDEQVLSLQKAAKQLRKEDRDFAADFLKLLNRKLEDELEVQYPDHIAVPRYYYCGIPAGWNEEKAAFADACDKAGLSGTILVSESEAAANAMLAMKHRPIKTNEVVLVIDSGGMTVDSQAYIVIQPTPPLTKAITTGNGLACGSAFTNLAFKKWLKCHPKLLNLNDASRESTVDTQAEAFEGFKKSFDGGLPSKDTSIFKSLKVFADQSRGRGWSYLCDIHITNGQMKAFFDKQIDKIIALAGDQITRCEKCDHSVDRILLTGGFAESPYYLKRMQTEYGRMNIERPNADAVNVPKGVVATALNQSSITEQKSRFSIGIDEIQDDDPNVHGKKEDIHVFVDDHEGQEVVESIHWLLKMDVVIPTPNNPIRHKGQRTIRTRALESDWLLREDIIVTKGEAKKHLDRLQKGTRRCKGQELADDLRDDCWAEGRPFMIDLRDLSESKRRSLLIKDPKRPGHGFLTMHYEIVLFFDKGDWVFQFIPSADRSIVISHSVFADSYYTMQTEIGTLVPTTAAEVTHDDNEGVGAEFEKDRTEEDAEGDIDDDIEDPVPSDSDDGHGLSAVQRGKRPARSIVPSRRSKRDIPHPPLPPPALRSLGENWGEKAPPRRAGAQKRQRDEDATSDASKRRGKKPRKTSLSLMDPLRYSNPDDGLYTLSGTGRVGR